MMKSKNAKARLLIFSKSPVLGEVKTRLQPEFSQQQSLKLHKKMMLDTLALSKDLTHLDTELCCTPNRNTSFFLECEKNFPLSLSNQQGDDLGERMAFSLSVALQTHDKVIIIGTDCPSIDTAYIEQALDELHKVDVVIGPADDGGYVLLGLRKFSPALFSGFSWGSDTVLAQTRQVLDELGWSFSELAVMHDIDRPEDLYRHKELLKEII